MRPHTGTIAHLARCLAAAVVFFSLTPARDAFAQGVAQSEHGAPSSVTVGGLVTHTLQLTADDVRAMPATTITVSFNTEHGTTSAAWTGVPLWTVIQRAGLDKAVTANRLTMLTHTVLATARDGYAVAFSLGELDPRFGASQAMVVYARDGQALPSGGLRLVVPGDKMGGRAVQSLDSLDVR
jgi:DMSO/TMAO reductase YedYZ molybdopterin-dependent catalytic subunit